MRVLQARCNCTEPELRNMTAEQCKGFKIFPRETFYPLEANDAAFGFDPINNEIRKRFLDMTENSYVIHFSNPVTGERKIMANSGYDLLAKRLCPRCHIHFGDSY